jgi:hypothetical protein
MSVLSTLALLVTTAAVKSKPKADRVAELEAEIAGLKIDLADARRDVDMWRERALASLDARPPQPQPYMQPAGLQQAQALLSQMAQAQYQNAQYAAMQNAQVYGQGVMQQQGMQQQGLLGAQALNPEMWCNCLPSRSQVWAASDGRNY